MVAFNNSFQVVSILYKSTIEMTIAVSYKLFKLYKNSDISAQLAVFFCFLLI